MTMHRLPRPYFVLMELAVKRIPLLALAVVIPAFCSAVAEQPAVRLDEMSLRCRGVVLLGAQQPIVLWSRHRQ